MPRPTSPRPTSPWLQALACIVAGAAAVAGCGGSADLATPFAKSWTFDSGSLTATCMAPLPMNPPPFDLTGLTMTLTKTGNSSLMLNGTLQQGGPPCTLDFTISGTTASLAKANQVCMVTINVGGTSSMYPITFQNWTFTLAGDTLTTSIAGSVALCTATGSGTLSPTGGADASSGG
jgi:hypothetical protein